MLTMVTWNLSEMNGCVGKGRTTSACLHMHMHSIYVHLCMRSSEGIRGVKDRIKILHCAQDKEVDRILNQMYSYRHTNK